VLRAVLADLHVGQGPGDIDRFVSAIAALRRRAVGEVVFLGDVFRALVGFSRFWDATVRRGLEEVARLRADGARVVMVEGNRDFFLDAPDLDPYRDVACTAHSFVAGGRRFLLEHGDLVNRSDRSYRFWRTVSKSAPARLWARLLPRRLAQRLVLGTEARLKETNFSYRRQLPVADLTAASRRHFAAGVDVVFWGHFHQPWRLVDGERAAYVIPGWLETGTVVWIDDDGAPRFEAGDTGQIVDTASSSWYEEIDSLVDAR
jgi:UDP-2,3-diacylglucosamine pyrophosphatase LpxH